MVKAKKDNADGAPSSEEQVSLIESKRLQDLAVSRGLLSRSKANPSAPLLPTKTIRKCDGKDIVKKGQRKTKYLFAFPGLVAPIAGGKFGELTNLDSRNPTFYVDFPEGRLKLFGTIVYPKNKYLTMHFAPGRGDIVCEDCFESLVVFPEAWWIGTKEENPEELQLSMPSNIQQGTHADFDFNAGAGRVAKPNETAGISKASIATKDPESPKQQFSVERLHEPASGVAVTAEELPLRRSGRTSAEKRSYKFALSDDSEGSSDGSESSDFKRKEKYHKPNDEETSPPKDFSDEEQVPDNVTKRKKPSFQAAAKSSLFASTTTEQVVGASASRGGLRQATLTSFLNNTDTPQTPRAEVIEIESSQQTAESGGLVRTSRKRFTEKAGNAHSSEERQPDSDTTPQKNVSSRGRGRGRGRGAKATSPGGRNTGSRTGASKRRQSITEISSSEESDEPSEESDTDSPDSDDSE